MDFGFPSGRAKWEAETREFDIFEIVKSRKRIFGDLIIICFL